MSTAPPLSDVVTIVRDRLENFLPTPTVALPHGVSLVDVRERTVGIGNRRGVQTHGGFSLVELKGLRLDATARFELWGADANDVNSLVETLQQDLLAAREVLFNVGYLKLEATDSSSAELVDIDLWRRTADYRLLFEHRFADTDGAQSLIARIPIHHDPEQPFSPNRETTIVTDEMARWDDVAAPDLDLRGPLTLARLAALSFVGVTPPSDQVTLTRSFAGAIGPTALSLLDFMDEVSNPTQPARNVRTTSTFSAFLDTFADAGQLALGDLDGNNIADTYQSETLSFGRVFTDLAIDASDNTRISSAARPFSDEDAGESLEIQLSAGFTAGRYRIVDVDGSAVATLERACGSTSAVGGSGLIARSLSLPTAVDTFTVSYQDSQFDQLAVLYLRAVP